jgi:glucose/arabinose dehydrogenase
MRKSALFQGAALTCFFLFSGFIMNAQLSLVPFVNNVSGVTDITNCGDDRLFIVEQQGRIRIADLSGNLLTRPFLNIDPLIVSGGEQGLLGLAFSPDYANDGRFYVNYTNNAGNTVIARYTVSPNDPDSADQASGEILFTVIQPYTNHNGGAMQFGADGFLYISLGDGGAGGDPGNRAQNLQDTLGKILRINVHTISGYSIPALNPFYGVPSTNPLIWAYGLRNAWRVTFDRMNGDLWIADVGQGAWEEINYQPASSTGGENYGWRCYEGNVPYNTNGCQPQSFYDAPVYVYPHGPGCSVSGGYVYRGAEFDSWFGKYFFTDYCSGEIQSLEPNGAGGFTHTSYGVFSAFNFSTFGEDKYGEMYIGKNSTGVLKMQDSTCMPVAFISENDTIFHCGDSLELSTPQGNGFIYQWYLDGNAIPGADSSVYMATADGDYHVSVVNTSFCINNSDPVTLLLTTAPIVTFSGLPQQVCENSPSISLTGNPSGGVFTGNGISGSDFNPAAAGIATHAITYIYDNGNGCIVSSQQNIVVDACLSLEENNNELTFSVYPNPAQNEINILLPKTIQKSITVEILDLAGKIVMQKYITDYGDMKIITINPVIAKGLYFIRIESEEMSGVKKFIMN